MDTSSPPPDAPLYRRILGEQFESLHPTLSRFHDSPTGGDGTGSFRVTRAPGRLRRLVAGLMGLPAAGESVEVRLRVRVRGRSEVWERFFAGRPFRTLQWEGGGLLLERGGPVCFGFALAAPEGGMTFERRKFWVLGVRLPLALAPAVEAVVTPDQGGWVVRVTVGVPILGQLVRYEGRLEPH